MTVALLAVIGVVVTRHIQRHYQSVCCSNQMIVVCFGAITWAHEHENHLPPDLLCLSNEVIITRMLVCPGDHSRQAAGTWSSVTASNISYEIAPPGMNYGDTNNFFLRCCSDPGFPRQALIYTCPECKRLRVQWEAEHTGPAPRATDLRNAFVYVDGEVLALCRCFWSNGWTLADAIRAAVGFTDHAKVSSVTIRHGTGVVEKVNCSRQAPSQWGSLALAPGDVVHVPRRSGFNLPSNKSVGRVSAGRHLWLDQTIWAAAIAHFSRSA
jgi:hypothetical protein